MTPERRILTCEHGHKYPVYRGGNTDCPDCFWRDWFATPPDKRRVGSPVIVGRWPKER